MANQRLWNPDPNTIPTTAMHRFMQTTGHTDYQALHRWSINDTDDFWQQWLTFSDIIYGGHPQPTCVGASMFGTRFFPNVTLNFAQNLLAHATGPLANTVAIISVSESQKRRTLTFAQLFDCVCNVAQWLRRVGVKKNDRVAGILPNSEEAVIAMLATTALGALWTSCSPDFGVRGVLDRFGQVTPKVLFAANGYRYGAKVCNSREKIKQISNALDGLEQLVHVSFLKNVPACHPDPTTTPWDTVVSGHAPPLDFEPFPFDHPVYIMYSSGTTGVPKCIVHGAGGTLLQHKKELSLHIDLRALDTLFYFTTCGWMMWNWLVSGLSVGARIVLYDGSPTYPSINRLWQLAKDEGITHFGTSPKFLGACRKQGTPLKIKSNALRVILSTGAPLLPEDFDWVYDAVKKDVQLSSISGGTDIISCFMLGNPMLPVYRGEIQCAGLGMNIAALNAQGQSVTQQKGELVCRTPFPSMPISFWDDANRLRYRNAYFAKGDDQWFHGDYIEMTQSQGSCGGIAVYGRSDSTLNPGGIRIGTAEIYRLVETLTEINDSIVVGLPHNGDIRVVLFVQLSTNISWTEQLETLIRTTIREGATPRHVPEIIQPIATIPYTLSGKKVELAVLQILCGKEPSNISALADATSLDAYRSIQL